MAEWNCRPSGCMEPSMMLETFRCLNVEGLGQIDFFQPQYLVCPTEASVD